MLLRLQHGVSCLGLLGILAGRRRWRLAAEAIAFVARAGRHALIRIAPGCQADPNYSARLP